MKKILAAFLCAILILAGCDSAADPAETTGADTTEPAAQEIALVTGGVSEYVIVRSDTASSSETMAAVYLRKYMEKCGVKTKITTDWEGNGTSDYEIVVGGTLRTPEQGNIFDPYSYGEEGYYAAASGTRIYLGGGSADALMKAVETFLTDFFGYAGDENVFSPVTDVRIPADYLKSVQQSYDITSLTLAGKPLSAYTLVVDAISADAYPAAEKLQNDIYRASGEWIEIANRGADPAGPVIRISPDKPAKENCFEVKMNGDDLIMKTDISGGLGRCVALFLDDAVKGKSGEVALAADYSHIRELSDTVLYSDFGAVGDGVTDDLAAIILAHDFANRTGAKVMADKGATYYIGVAAKGATVKTDTDWSGAKFILDDSNVSASQRSVAIFNVTSTKPSYSIAGKINPVLPKDSTNVGMTFPEDSVIHLTQKGTKRYIRKGNNQNDGSDQTELINVDKNGNIDPKTPLNWDYTNITGATVIPMDETTLTLTGGEFTTIANQLHSSDGYFARGIKITRSNVVVRDLVHYVTGERSDQGAPYSGILVIQNCSDVTVQDCTFTGHKTYSWTKPTGKVSQGTYDISPSRVNNLTFKNCRQTNDILETSRWGIMGSNFCKNIVVDGCSFSRFDAHQGVANVTILNSTLGHQCLNAIGSGLLRVEGTTLYGSSLINLRTDYGATWEGDVIIKDCTWIPNKGNQLSGTHCIIGGKNTEDHDFGYQCYMPANITIENLHIDDSKALPSFPGVYLFADFSPNHLSVVWEKNVMKYPIIVTEHVTIKNLTTASGKGWKLSGNTFMFNNVVIEEIPAEVKE